MAFNHKSLKELVYLHLYEKINNGTLKPREKINESQLCKDIDVSRTPIREALIQLEDEGYIERLPRRGFTVKEISQDTIKAIYQILGCLEGFAATLAIDRLTDKDLEDLRILVKKMDEAIAEKKVQEYFRLQRNFHNVYISICGNSELSDLITSLKKRFVKKAYYLSEDQRSLYETMERNNNGHKHIIELLEKRDKAGLNSYLRDVHWNLEGSSNIVSPFESPKRKRELGESGIMD
jgi:DNA-binding GntR family transcriptional regulator